MSKDAHGVTAWRASSPPCLPRIVGWSLLEVYSYKRGVHKAPRALRFAFNKGLHFHMGQMHGPKYIPRLFDYTRRG